MAEKIVREVAERRPRQPGDDWWFLLDLAAAADDATRRADFGTVHTRTAPADIPRLLDQLTEQGLIVFMEHDDGRTAYEIPPLPPRAVPEPAAAAAPEETALYRIFGEADLLLYIGISKSFGRRWKDEARDFSWWNERRHMTVRWYLSREDAETAERDAIKAEHPKYNKMHASPGARRAPAAQAGPQPEKTDRRPAA